jgi:DNA polymerase-3 subunit chi
MTKVQFYHNAADPLELACEFAAKAYAGGRRVALLVPDAETATQLDRMLWSMEPPAFIPHVLAGSALAFETPVIIGRADEAFDWPHDELLFNLADDVPTGFQRFRMVVEIVGESEGQKRPARARWMHYKNLGLPLQAFDAVRREAL